MRPKVKANESSEKKRHRLFTTMAIRSVAELRKHLDRNSISNGRVHPFFIPKARDYVISEMMKEVEKAAISSLVTSDFILKSNAQKKTDEQQNEQEEIVAEMAEIEGNIFQSRIDEMVL